jgi:hypothetical protein
MKLVHTDEEENKMIKLKHNSIYYCEANDTIYLCEHHGEYFTFYGGGFIPFVITQELADIGGLTLIGEL